jgi:preprotein translocase subunit YajC
LKISKVIFYTKDFNEKIDYPVDIVLSPQFYWIKKIDIKIKNLYQAKKIAKNIFDLEGDFIFDAFKIDDNYFAVAINKNLDIKIDKKYIKSLRLAQVELYKFDCLGVNENFSLKKIDDILFCLPKNEDCKNINEVLNDIKLSKYTISLDTINLDKTSLILIFISFIFLISYFLIGTFSYKKDLALIEKKQKELSKYNLPLTSFQLNAIYENLKEIDVRQKRLRKDLEFFSHTPLKLNEEYIKLSLNKDYYVKIKTSSNLDNYFKKRFRIIESSLKNKIYSAKFSYE